MKITKKPFTLKLLSLILLGGLTACAGGVVTPGGGGNITGGATGGSTSVGANEGLERCSSPLGTLVVAEDMNSPWYTDYRRATGQTSVEPMLKLIIQQSNCFMVISDSYKVNDTIRRQRDLMDSGELRSNSKMGKGQRKAADYVLETSVAYSESAGGMGGLVGGLFGSTAAAVAAGLEQKHTSVNLNLTDVRSAQQVSASEGSASASNFGGAIGGLFGGVVPAGLGGYTRTPEGKSLAAAFLDAYSKMVVAVKNYKQQVDPTGASGRGGKLNVQ